jgi:NADPH:quinone reductase-like Zn-dependent oxidoreductase
MKAVVLRAYGGVEQLSYEDVEKPKPAVGEVLVRIAAASVNPIDWKLRSGAMRSMFPLNFPAVLGRDMAGEIVELGHGVSGFAIGQRVMALTNRTYADYAVVNASDLALVPDSLGFEEAAALPLVTLTGAQLIEIGTHAKEGQAVLLTGAVGSVGRSAAFVAIQHKIQVIAVVRESQMDAGEDLGTVALVAADDEAGLAMFQQIDAIADTVGGAIAVGLLKHLRHGGVFASVVGIPKEVRNYDLHPEQVVVKPDAERLAELAQAVALHQFKIPIAQVMKLSEIQEAHRLGEAGGLGGKIVLVPGE